MSARADRFNKGKRQLRYLLCFSKAAELLATVSEYGASKYNAYNFVKGAPVSESVDSLMRHLDAWWNGEDIDPESGCHHLGHVAWNAMRLAHEARSRPDLDDRPHVVLAARAADTAPQETFMLPPANEVAS